MLVQQFQTVVNRELGNNENSDAFGTKAGFTQQRYGGQQKEFAPSPMEMERDVIPRGAFVVVIDVMAKVGELEVLFQGDPAGR